MKLLRGKSILFSYRNRRLAELCFSCIQQYLSLSLLTLSTLVLCLVVACNNTSSPDSSSNPQFQLPNCRVVKHAIGETCVPLNPQRVLTLDPFSLENTLAFGIQPVGFAMSSDWLDDRDYLRDRLSGVEVVGEFYQPSIEKILALKPDLILGLARDEKIYPQLKQIAPTVLLKLETSEQWKEVLAHNANSLGKTDLANSVMADYTARLDKFKTQVDTSKFSSNQKLLHQMDVSIIRVTDSGVVPYLSNIFCSSILRDAGLNLIPEPGNYDGWQISKERLSELDADVIFVWSYGYQPELSQESQSVSMLIKTDPLWQQLRAVKEGHVYVVPSYWIGSGILSANAVIDDLLKYLLEET